MPGRIRPASDRGADVDPASVACNAVPPTDRRLYRTLVFAAVAAGILCRTVQYLAHPSLWHDEALLVLNIMDRTYAGLARPLDYGQAAPPLFLWAERALLLHAGFSEYALRIVPLLSGIGALLLFALLACRLLPQAVAPWAVAWFALCGKLVWHSAEVKQYSGDVLAATLLTFLVVGRRRAGSDATRLLTVAFLAAVAIWFSFPAIFVFGAASLMLDRKSVV